MDYLVWIVLIAGRIKTQLLAHRVAYYLDRGELLSYRHVCHKCDNPKCCNPNHMFDGSMYDNVQDMIAKGVGICALALSALALSQKGRVVNG